MMPENPQTTTKTTTNPPMMMDHNGQNDIPHQPNGNNGTTPPNYSNHIPKEQPHINNHPAQEFNTSGNDDKSKETIRFRDWGFKLDRLFEVAYRFYKRNESKAFHPTFDERNHMNALILQARYGNFDSGKIPDVGVLDLVGKRRQYEWSLLKGMSKTEAMSKFICLMDELCPFFKAHAEAVKISSGIGISSDMDVTPTANHNGNALSKINPSIHQESSEQLQAIYSSLCRQTHDQFKSYAEKQFPNDISQQRTMISTLQDQYYQQYISQMHPELIRVNIPESGNISSTLIPSSVPSSTSSESSSMDKNAILNLNNDNNNRQEEQDIQADISSEELNASDDTNIISISQQPSSQSINNREDLVQSEPSKDTRHQNYVEPVRLYQNIEPPIGPFESFPEPKPVLKSQQQAQMSSLETIDPNMPRKSLAQQSTPTAHPTPIKNHPPPDTTMPLNGMKISNDDKSDDTTTPLEPPYDLTEADCYCEEGQEGASSSPKELWNYSPPPQPLVPDRPLEAATIWSKPGVSEFKLSLADDKQGGLYEVKQSTLVCIQVPTYKDGKYIYFEFATDDYDIGFGLDFVYDLKLSEPLAINIYEESEDDEEDDMDDRDQEADEDDHHEHHHRQQLAKDDQWQSPDGQMIQRDIESGQQDGERLLLSSNVGRHQTERAARMRRLANTIQIIPKYRRNSHEEVFVGRHRYPGTGYYLLKFDNTYSVLRSKSLYFRICYFV